MATDIGTPSTETRRKARTSTLDGKPTPGKDGPVTVRRTEDSILSELLTKLTTAPKPERNNGQTISHIARRVIAETNPGRMTFSSKDSASTANLEDRRKKKP